MGGALATVLVALLGVVASYVVAPSQEVASQLAIEDHQRLQDAENAPVSIEDVYGQSVGDGPNVASNEVVDLDGVVLPRGEIQSFDTNSLLPSAVPLGLAVYDDNYEPVSGSTDSLEFTLTGNQSTPTRIRDIRVKVTDRQDAPKGTVIYFPPQGSVDDLKLSFDLDSADTSARSIGENGDPTSAHYFRDKTVTLAKGEALGFKAVISTVDCACAFVLEIEFGDDRILQIDNNGKPFFLSAFRTDAERFYTMQYRNDTDGSSTSVLTRCPSMSACSGLAYQEAPR